MACERCFGSMGFRSTMTATWNQGIQAYPHCFHGLLEPPMITNYHCEACAESCWWNRLGTRWIPRWLWHPWKGVTKHAKGAHNSSKVAAECHLKSKGVCYREFESLGFAWSAREPFRLSLAWWSIKRSVRPSVKKKPWSLGQGKLGLIQVMRHVFRGFLCSFLLD
jgi:hypothetical protein